MPFAVLLFILVPTLELVLLIKLGSFIGALPTVAIVFITAILGASLLRREGFSTLMKAQNRMESGQMPAQELVEGALLVMSGAFLLTPGFITDSVGFACLIPSLRRRMASALLKRISLQMGSVTMYSSTSSTASTSSVPGQTQEPPGKVIEGEVIEGEFQNRD
jgi:UPF0716 protein FxsA